MPRRYSMDIRKEETAARRRRLLDAAIEVLGEVGAARLTMEAVAERADAATRTLYNHFSSREQLIAEALHRLIQEFRDAMDVQPSDLGNPTERLASFVRLPFHLYPPHGPPPRTLPDHRH